MEQASICDDDGFITKLYHRVGKIKENGAATTQARGFIHKRRLGSNQFVGLMIYQRAMASPARIVLKRPLVNINRNTTYQTVAGLYRNLPDKHKFYAA